MFEKIFKLYSTAFPLINLMFANFVLQYVNLCFDPIKNIGLEMAV